ncbi:hypothetical protein DENSPDRAFT_454897 [Dentipellis sp. KUC8613]|nr:hypothetical protein DENSPDRAFT_454897 [Dentipellis sp. KUC8613]
MCDSEATSREADHERGHRDCCVLETVPPAQHRDMVLLLQQVSPRGAAAAAIRDARRVPVVPDVDPGEVVERRVEVLRDVRVKVAREADSDGSRRLRVLVVGASVACVVEDVRVGDHSPRLDLRLELVHPSAGGALTSRTRAGPQYRCALGRAACRLEICRLCRGEAGLQFERCVWVVWFQRQRSMWIDNERVRESRKCSFIAQSMSRGLE